MINFSRYDFARIATVCTFSALAAPVFAQALPASLKLTFTQQSGVVSASASVPVMLTLTNNSTTQSFVVNNALPNFGLNPSLIPANGSYFDSSTSQYVTAPFASYSSAGFGGSFGCSGTFTANCTAGPPYSFTFGNGLTAPLSLAPGASTTYSFGTFVPSAGPVAPGTYSFYYAAASLYIYGLDAAGHSLSNTLNPISLAETCPGQSAAACGAAGFFTRTVTAVPEPGQGALLALGLVALAFRTLRGARR